jgi:hypothetical protein
MLQILFCPLVSRGAIVSGSREIDNSLSWMAQTRTRLALRRAEKPATKAGQIRALWPDIEAALAVGQTIKSICKWLEEDAGITLGVTSLTSYISRIRHRENANRFREVPTPQSVRSEPESIGTSSPAFASVMAPPSGGPVPNQFDDPLAQAMRVLSKPKMDIRKIHNDGDPEGRNLI